MVNGGVAASTGEGVPGGARGPGRDGSPPPDLRLAIPAAVAWIAVATGIGFPAASVPAAIGVTQRFRTVSCVAF